MCIRYWQTEAWMAHGTTSWFSWTICRASMLAEERLIVLPLRRLATLPSLPPMLSLRLHGCIAIRPSTAPISWLTRSTNLHWQNRFATTMYAQLSFCVHSTISTSCVCLAMCLWFCTMERAKERLVAAKMRCISRLLVTLLKRKALRPISPSWAVKLHH